MIDKIQRAILENQIILAEALWALLNAPDTNLPRTLNHVSQRIMETRKLLDEEDK